MFDWDYVWFFITAINESCTTHLVERIERIVIINQSINHSFYSSSDTFLVKHIHNKFTIKNSPLTPLVIIHFESMNLLQPVLYWASKSYLGCVSRQIPVVFLKSFTMCGVVGRPFIFPSHHHWAAVVSRGWAKASACHFQVSLSCAVVCHIVSLQYLSRSSLHRLAGLPCRLCFPYGLQMVTREVHRSSLRRLICPAQDHFIFLTVLMISMTFVLSPDPDVGLSILVCDVELISFHLVCTAASLFVLGWPVSSSLHHMS